jgi:hypothetical protein
VGASPTGIVSFHGVGVTIEVTFPEEAHPTENITHIVTLTANANLTLQNSTIFVFAPVASGWQQVFNQSLINFFMLENQNLTNSLKLQQLPQDTNGTLRCLIYVLTDQSADYSAYIFYTTRVSELTFSEMQSLYYEMLANYTALQTDYATLLNEYNGLLADYSSLFANYTALLSEHNDLLAKYNAQVSTYQTLLNNHEKLSSDYNTLNSNYGSKTIEYNALQTDYKSLNDTRYSLQTDYDSLQAVFDALNQTYVDLQTAFANLQSETVILSNALNIDRVVMFIFVAAVASLIALVIYLKRKEPEPYVVIRKETVTVKPDETSPQT